MPETWRAQRDRNDEGKVIFNQQSAEKPMEQTSASTGERREFLEAFLQYNRAFHAHHLSGTLKYRQDAYRTTVDIDGCKEWDCQTSHGIGRSGKLQLELSLFC